MKEKFKTIHENKSELEQFYSKSIIEKLQPLQMVESIKTAIMQLDRYSNEANSGGQDCWCTMDKDKDGEYVLFEDIIKLFMLNKS